MRIESAFSAGHLIAEMANDIWQSKHRLLSKEKPFIYLAYRLSVTDMDKDTDYNFYVHFVVKKDRWWATINDDAPFALDDPDSLINFRDESDNWDTQITSWRHYAFSDLLSDAVQKKIEAITADMSRPGEPYLWSTFPIEDTPRFSEDAMMGTLSVFDHMAAMAS